jgi:hypothetical protein
MTESEGNTNAQRVDEREVRSVHSSGHTPPGLGLPSCLYSAECVEKGLSEVQIQDCA